ncbi:MAG: HupE/UreJ family protein [Sphingobacteriaceae bacterium]|nr:HupE/UreJ family protein [Sphingobacteriaceae bacterium]
MNEFSLWFVTGLEHITTDGAYDHILFVALITLAYTVQEWKKILILITGFTLGHSVSLALSVYDVFVLNQALAEILIASTILLTACFELFRIRQSSMKNARILYVFIPLFGGIHGMGFSYLIRSMLGNTESPGFPLLFFNAGIEIGQLLIVIIVILFYLILSRTFKVTHNQLKIFIACVSVLFSIVILIQRLFYS